MATTCSNCRSPMGDDDAFCGICGQPASVTNGSSPLPATVMAEPAGATMMEIPPWPAPESATVPPMPIPQIPQLPQPSASVGQASPNTTYMGLRLAYSPTPEPTFDPIFNWRFLVQMLVRYWLYGWVYLIGAIAGVIICAIIALAGGFGVAVVLFYVAALAVGLVLTCCFWFLTIPIQLSEWKLSIDGKGPAAPTVFEHIAWVLRGRGAPLDLMQVRRMRLPGEGVRDYLELRRGIFSGYVACFPYGTDLYVGWTFWIRLSPFRWICMVVARLWQSVTNRGSDLYTSLRYDSARAMREVMHSATREGVDVAVGRIAGQGHGLVGSAIGVVETAG